MFAKIVTIAATGIAAVHACYPATPFPVGTNLINYPLTTDYPTMGQPYFIQWDNTNEGATVTLSLYKGCPDNCVEVTDVVGGVANTGVYNWKVPCTADYPFLQPDTDALGYAILLIDEKGCKSQWSQNFGIHPDTIGCCGTNPGAKCNAGVAASSAAATSTTTTAASTTTTATTATSATTTLTTKASTTTTATSKKSTATPPPTLTGVATTTTAAGGAGSKATASAISSGSGAAPTTPAQAIGGLLAVLAAGLVL